MKKVVVISLGGSLIFPDKVNFEFLDKFKKSLRRHYRTHRFVVVCGGGTIARKYISALKKEGKPSRELAAVGIRTTRMNAMFMMQFFGKEANDKLPLNMKEVKDNLPKNNIVICGALRFEKKSTSDTTAAELAHYLKTDFINMTNIDGLYTENPLKNPKAKFIPFISWKDFEDTALKLKYKAGQNFVLDQNAAVMIRKHRTRTFIIGPKLSNLDKIWAGKKFVGTKIDG
jgi:uridylate kinase